jgi:hypothetical protein
MAEMWDSVAPGWEANAGFVDIQLAVATGALLDAAQIGEDDRVLDAARPWALCGDDVGSPRGEPMARACAGRCGGSIRRAVPPPNVRGPFSLDTPDLLTCVLRDRGLEGVTLTTIDVGSLAVIPLAVVVALMLARRLPNQYR